MGLPPVLFLRLDQETMVTSTASSVNSPTFEERVKRTALNRWKLETLTGLLGYRSLKHHQQESEKNQEAENAAGRRAAWGDCGVNNADSDMGDTILGDVTTTHHHQAPASSGIGKALVGAAIAAGLIGIPAAGIIGYGVSQLMAAKPAATTGDNTLDIGLGRFEDLKE